jgi:hypothetical protein
MSVERFDPDAVKGRVSQADLQRLLDASAHLDVPDFGLSSAEAARLAAVSRHPDVDWQAPLAGLDDGELLALIRLFTLAEGALPGWQAGAKSPVIVLAAALRQRDAYPREITAWIKANTDNRFLPYGDLMARL